MQFMFVLLGSLVPVFIFIRVSFYFFLFIVLIVLCHLITSTDDGCVSIKYLISVHTAALMQRSCSSLAMPIVFRYRAIKQDLWCMMQRCTAAAAAAATNMQRP